MNGAGQPLWQMLLPMAVIGVVLALRFKSITKPRPLRPGRLWIQPMILIGLAAMTIGLHPPGLLGSGLCILVAMIGGAIGWHRGKLMRIEHDPETGTLTQAASPAAILLLLGILAVRYAARNYFIGNPTPGQLDAHTLLVTDVLLCFAVAMIAATRVEMGLRAKAILAAAGNRG